MGSKKSKDTKKTTSGKMSPNDNKKITTILKSKKLGFILSGIQGVVTAVFIGLLIYLNMLPAKYLVPVIFILLLFLGYDVFSQFSKKFRTSGKIVAVLITIVLIIGSFFVAKANQLFDGITGSNTKTDVIGVYVLKEDPAKTLGDAKDYSFGILKGIDRKNTDNTVSKINTTVGKTIQITEYNDMISIADALLNGEIKGIVINSAFIKTICDDEQHMDFDEKIRELDSVSFTSTIEDTGVKNITKDPFSVYISGIDVYGPISTTSRSDVNIIATVNPQTKQVLLVSTPRDYYIPTTVSGGAKDKLTHAGIYGIDCSMGTLGNFYEIQIPYYFRLNFTGFEQVIDALGGVTVNSDVSFTTTHGGYAIKNGDNQLSGKKALGFARERYSLSGGDRDRGKNQMKVVKAVIDKACSTAVLNDFNGLISSLTGSFETNLSSDELSDLVKMELSDMASWNVVQYSVDGSGKKDTTYSMPNANSYVMEPDMNTVNTAKQLMKQVINGESISDPAATPEHTN